MHSICALFVDTLGRDETLSTVETSDLNGPPIESPSTTCPPNPPTASLSLSQPLDHGIASRFAFNEADDGWNQDGWFDEDEQASFEIDPPTSDHGKFHPRH